MLRNDFYTILSMEQTGEAISGVICFQAAHPIFAGHFPAQPVVPGVCSMEIVKEILELVMEEKLILRQAGHAKFLGMIDPQKTPEVKFQIQYKATDEGAISVNATISSGEMIFLKYAATFAAKA